MSKLFLGSLRLVPPLIAKRAFKNCLWEGPADCGMIALTFDDGPDPEVTPAVLDTLDAVGGRGTFFLRGDRASQYPEVARLIGERGHVIGNHSMNHRRMLFMRRRKVLRAIDDAQAAIADATGEAPRFFRPPYGHFSGTAGRAVRERGMVMVLWTVLAGDFEKYDPDALCERVRPFIRPGSIIVFHDTQVGGGEMLPGVIERVADDARKKSIRLAGIDELVEVWERERDR